MSTSVNGLISSYLAEDSSLESLHEPESLYIPASWRNDVELMRENAEACGIELAGKEGKVSNKHKMESTTLCLEALERTESTLKFDHEDGFKDEEPDIDLDHVRDIRRLRPLISPENPEPLHIYRL